ncbi:CRISPR-associated protein Cas5 [Yanshouia hominis]|uniref:CRISPR-associated protein Cas5 n=1 Tax=Yanshouia hominis TaxID=2763673 RepID=A0ABR7NNK5_9FIRM|nr:CRISPR-associated protein Cas5 [Yanshouia hominis]MBC8577795.1 CRISPR-associated protein Cas5 [Yanshouia hominis]
MIRLSYPVEMEIAGSTAMWTRPDTGDCPVSYPAPTYSAVKAIFESVLWGPDVEIIPTRVELCTPIQYHSYCTNYGGPLRSSKAIKDGNNYQLYATVLIDVCYKLYAEVVPNRMKNQLPESAIQWDAKTTSPGHAYQCIFKRRLRRGQCYSIPTLGWREFTPSYLGERREMTSVLVDMPDVVIPSMLRQVFSKGYNSPVSYVYDNDLMIRNGVLEYPKRGVAV